MQPTHQKLTVSFAVDSMMAAVNFGQHLHKLLRQRKARSLNQALNMCSKDRKSLDRFKHVYYLYQTDRSKAEEVMC